MKIKNYSKLMLNEHPLNAYSAEINVLHNKDIIFPHEETHEMNYIDYEIIKNSVIVLGVEFDSSDKELIVKDQLFILDGHHRFEFIVDNSINESLDVVLVDLFGVKIESYNSKLLIEEELFSEKIKSEKNFLQKNNSEFYISINNVKYFSDNISDIKELYSYKKRLLKDLVISPIKNNENTNETIINFTPISAWDFGRDIIFPYKSTWITPRFDV